MRESPRRYLADSRCDAVDVDRVRTRSRPVQLFGRFPQPACVVHVAQWFPQPDLGRRSANQPGGTDELITADFLPSRAVTASAIVPSSRSQWSNDVRSFTIVTGGSRGMGAAVSRRLAADGNDVVIGYRADAAAMAAVDTLTVGSSKQFAAHNIRVDAVAPEIVATDFHRDTSGHRRWRRTSPSPAPVCRRRLPVRWRGCSPPMRGTPPDLSFGCPAVCERSTAH